MAEVTLSNLSKSFGATKALKDVSMTIPDGAFVELLGPTGAGGRACNANERGKRQRVPTLNPIQLNSSTVATCCSIASLAP